MHHVHHVATQRRKAVMHHVHHIVRNVLMTFLLPYTPHPKSKRIFTFRKPYSPGSEFCGTNLQEYFNFCTNNEISDGLKAQWLPRCNRGKAFG
ncbi:hypothetical protein Y032_0101g3349 [Ancylostoma ceylanicum]|uniref:Uncharacterized protein n=1 Tax=Ancylostoma ceylanicum TaxID=53326 RepID=A0A016THQ4_9BILA|nr:hypothetical protein Y032_0101g3349 [Ancylostoma ceylanicum]